jgi:hypothetical protein
MQFPLFIKEAGPSVVTCNYTDIGNYKVHKLTYFHNILSSFPLRSVCRTNELQTIRSTNSFHSENCILKVFPHHESESNGN